MISNTTKNTKFCTDCKYKSFAISTCKYPEFATITKNNDYLVNGQENTTRYPYCSDMRNDENKCGKEAKYFKQITKEDINELFENEEESIVKRLLILLFVLLLFLLVFFITNNTFAATPSSFHKAKKILYTQIYDNKGKTFYCGCDWNKKKVDLASCDYKIRKNKKRALRTEAEHIVPAYYLAMLTTEGRKCWSEGTKLKGTSGRKYCIATNKKFKEAHNDLMNLVPAIGEINGDRSNYRFAMLQGEPRNYGSCDMEIDRKAKKAEPPAHVRGDIARVYFYMQEKYGLQLSKQTTRLMQIWHKQDPMDKVEQLKIDKIEQIQE
jgi:deoxyribonuclease-1